MARGIANRRSARAVSVTLVALSCFAMIAMPHRFAFAREDELDADDIATLFSIRKSANHNRVDYGLRLDASCRPTGDAPVVPYWRMLEEGAGARAPLLPREQRAYGIASQRVTLAAEGGRVSVRLRAVSDRTVVVDVRRTDDRCVARSVTAIGGVQAALDGIFVELRGGMLIEYVELSGRATSDGTPVTERMSR